MEINVEELTIKQIREISSLTAAHRSKSASHVRAERPVVVRSSGGVYFGYLVEKSGTYCKLLRARHIRLWKSAPGKKAINCGDLAVVGAGPGTNITRPVTTEISTYYCIYSCTQEATTALEELPCE